MKGSLFVEKGQECPDYGYAYLHGRSPLTKDVIPLSDAARVFNSLRDNKSALFGTVFRMTG